MATLIDYLEGLPEKDAARLDRLQRLTKTARALDTTTKKAEALGVDTNTDPSPGVLDTIMAVLGAPHRAISAAVLEATNDSDPNIRARDFLTSVIDAGKNEFQPGFGDLDAIQYKSGDSPGKRVAKGLAAFVGDVATDPLTYVGAPSSIGRKAAAVALFNESDNILKSVTTKLSSTEADTLIDNLYKSSRRGRLAEADIKAGRVKDDIKPDSNVGRVGYSYEDVLDPTGSVVGKVLKPNKETKRVIAQEHLGDLLSEALLVDGRAGVLKVLKDTIPNKVNVEEVYKALPADIRGGVGFVNPLTGKSLYNPARLPADNSITRLGNRVRFNASASNFAQPTSRFLSGKYEGPTYWDVKSGLKAKNRAIKEATETKRSVASILDDANRTTMGDFVLGQSAYRDFGNYAVKLSRRGLMAINAFARGAQDLTDSEADVWTNAANKYFHTSRTDGIDVSNPIAVKAIEDAKKLRSELATSHKELQQVDSSVGDLGPSQAPLVLTDEAYESRLQRFQLSSGGDTLRYNPDDSRTTWVQYEPDDDVRNLIGYATEDGSKLAYLSPMEINDRILQAKVNKAIAEGGTNTEIDERVNKVIENFKPQYLEDPIQIATKVLEHNAHKVSGIRFMQTLNKLGLTTIDTATVNKTLNDLAVARALETARNATPYAKDNVTKLLAKIEDDIAAYFNMDANMIKEINKLKSTKTSYIKEYNDAKALESVIRTKLHTVKSKMETRNAMRFTIQRILKNKGLSRADYEFEVVTANYRTVQRKLRDAKNTPNYDPAKIQLLQDELDATRLLKQTIVDNRNSVINNLTGEELRLINNYIYDITMHERYSVQLLDVVNRRRAARANFEKVSSLSYVDDLNELQRAVDLVVSARSKVAQATSKAPAGVADSVVLQAQREYDSAMLAYKDRLRRIRSGTSRTKNTYLRDLIESLDKTVKNFDVTATEFTRLLNTEEKLASYVAAVANQVNNPEAAMAAMGDLMRNYRLIRDYLTKKDLDNLEPELIKGLDYKKKDIIKEQYRPSDTLEEIKSKANPNKSQNLQPVTYGMSNNVSIPVSVTGVYATKGIREMLEAVYRIEKDQTAWRKFIKDIFDPLQLMWKTGVTVGRGPAYTLQNLVGGLYMNYLDNVKLRYHNDSVKALTSMFNLERSLAKSQGDLTYVEREENLKKELISILTREVGDKPIGDLLVDFLERGGFQSTDTYFTMQRISKGIGTPLDDAFSRPQHVSSRLTDEPRNKGEEIYRNVVHKVMTWKVQRGLNLMASYSEMFPRFAAFLDSYATHKNLDTAMNRVYALHFDYQNLSDAEEWVRRIAPFYTWVRNSVPLAVRSMFVNPGKIARVEHAQQALQDSVLAPEDDKEWLNRFLPEYAKVAGGFLTGINFNDDNLMWMSRLPYEDANRMLDTSLTSGIPFVRERELANMASPFITIPYELASGVNADTGVKFNDRLKAAPGYITALGQYVPFLPKTDTGEVGISDRWNKVITDLLPQLGTIERAVSGVGALNIPAVSDAARWASSEAANDKGMTNLINFLGLPAAAGGAMAQLTPQSIQGEMMRQSEIIRNRIANMVDDKKIDVEWLDEQLKMGTPPEIILKMVEAGAGRVKLNINEMSEQERINDRERRLEALKQLTTPNQ